MFQIQCELHKPSIHPGALKINQPKLLFQEEVLSGGDTCSTLVPPKSTLFLSAPVISRRSSESRSIIDSLPWGVDSPDSIASLTMQEPSIITISHGTAVSSVERTTHYQPKLLMEQISPGRSSSDSINCHPLRYTFILNGFSERERNSLRVRSL